MQKNAKIRNDQKLYKSLEKVWHFYNKHSKIRKMSEKHKDLEWGR